MKKNKIIFSIIFLLSVTFTFGMVGDCNCESKIKNKTDIIEINHNVNNVLELYSEQMPCDKILKGRLSAVEAKYGFYVYYFAKKGQGCPPGLGGLYVQARGEILAAETDYAKCVSGQLGGGDPIWDMPAY